MSTESRVLPRTRRSGRGERERPAGGEVAGERTTLRTTAAAILVAAALPVAALLLWKSTRALGSARSDRPTVTVRTISRTDPADMSVSSRTRSPLMPTAAAHQARFLLRRGRIMDAERLLRETTRRFPSNPALQFYLGVSRLKQGRAREALPPLLRAAAEEPTHAQPLHRLADAYRMLGDHADADSALSRADRLGGSR